MMALSFDDRLFIIGNMLRRSAKMPGAASGGKVLFVQQPLLMGKRLVKSLLTAFGLMLLSLAGAAHSADNPHVVTRQIGRSGCAECHIDTPELKNDGILNTEHLPVDPGRFKQDGVAMCRSCHTHEAHIHKNVSEKIDFPVPADMPLSQDNGIICLTCHYSHGSLDSDQPRANVSFIDHLFNTERLHKSFLLRRDNSDGGLCLTCHAADDGSKR